MNTIDKIREKFEKHPEARFMVKGKSITFLPDNDDGFTVSLSVQPGRFIVSFDGWHEEFQDFAFPVPPGTPHEISPL